MLSKARVARIPADDDAVGNSSFTGPPSFLFKGKGKGRGPQIRQKDRDTRDTILLYPDL